MATNATFVEWLKWARAYRRNHDAWALRDVWRNRLAPDVGHLRYPLLFCESEECAEAILGRAANQRRGRGTGIFACSHCGKCRNHCECAVCNGCGCDTTDHDNDCADCEQCMDCCSCIRCVNCNDRCNDDYCGHCNRCTSCCDGAGECFTCEQCGVRRDRDDVDNTDDDQWICTRCAGRIRGRVRFAERPLQFRPASRLEHKINPSRRFISAEIEVSSIKDGDAISRATAAWGASIVHDGSLPPGGFEINTTPASGDKFVEQIDEYGRALAEGQAKADASCGLHVHIDARDFDHYAIRRLVRIYAAVEDALYKMCSPSRSVSNYCMPCGERYLRAVTTGKLTTKELKQNVTDVVYGIRACDRETADILKSNKGHKYNEARYHALNLHSWFYRGTIECRMFNGTVDADKIKNWGMLWARLLDAAYEAADAEIPALIAGSPYEALIAVAKRPALQDFIRERTKLHGLKGQ